MFPRVRPAKVKKKRGGIKSNGREQVKGNASQSVGINFTACLKQLFICKDIRAARCFN